MRENEKNLNVQDDQKNIGAPIFWVTAILAVLVAVMIWFGIKNPVIFGNLRDLLITLAAVLLFLIGAAFAFLCFYLASGLKGARKDVDEWLSTADVKVEELAGKLEEILRKILNPVIEAESKKAGFLHIFHRKKTEE